MYCYMQPFLFLCVLYHVMTVLVVLHSCVSIWVCIQIWSLFCSLVVKPGTPSFRFISMHWQMITRHLWDGLVLAFVVSAWALYTVAILSSLHRRGFGILRKCSTSVLIAPVAAAVLALFVFILNSTCLRLFRISSGLRFELIEHMKACFVWS